MESIATEMMQELHSDRDKIVANSDFARSAVTMFFNELHMTLDQREKAILNTVQKYADIKLSTLDLYHQKLQEDQMAITKAVESLETLLHKNDNHLNCSLLTSGEPLEEELEVHTHSVLSVCENFKQEKFAAKSLSFSGDQVLLSETLKEVGVLNECQQIPDTNILSMQHVVVSDQEDPYLLVPSRFEDLLTGSQLKEVRIDGRKKSQRVMKMSDLVEDDNVQYQIPRDWIMGTLDEEDPPLKIQQQPIKNGLESSIIECQPVDLEGKPLVPPRKTRGRIPPTPPPRAGHNECQPPLLPPKRTVDSADGDRDDDIYDVPRLAVDGDTTDIYDVPLQDPTTSEDIYDVPRLADLNDIQQDIYDVPRSQSTMQQDIYDVPRSPEPSAMQQDIPHSQNDVQQDIYDVPRPQDTTAAADDIYSVPNPQDVTQDIYDVPKLQDISATTQDIYDVPKNSPLLSPLHMQSQQQQEDDIYDVPRDPSPPEILPPPRPPKPGETGLKTPISPPPRGPSPKPKPRAISFRNFDYINTKIPVHPGRNPVSPAHSSQSTEQQLSASVSVTPNGKSKPIPTPRVRRSQTFANGSPSLSKQPPQSAPPIDSRSKQRFQWNGEAHSTDTKTSHMSTLPPDIKLRGHRSGLKEPVKVITSKQLCQAVGDKQVYPCGVCCSPVTDTLVMTDVYNHCVRLVDPNTGRVLERIGKEGRSGGNFKEPSAVVMDNSEHIFVTELDNPRVQKFTSRGKYLLKFGQKAFWGSQLHDPYGLTLSPDGKLYITDWEKGRVLIYQKDGRHISTIGKDKDHTFLKFPAGLVFDRQGNLLVTDRGKHCVWVMSPDGTPISRIGKLGTGNGELLLPHGIAVLNDNTIAVSESGNHRISIFAPNGNFIRSFGQKGTDPGMFHYPRHVCVDRKGRLIVADEHNQRIQIFDVN